MKNVKRITLTVAAMLFIGLVFDSDQAFADHCNRGSTFGFSLPNLGLYIDDHGVSLTGPRIHINTRHGYRTPYYDPYCPSNRRYDPYRYQRYRYTPPYHVPQYDHRYYDQLRRQRQLQDQIRREQDRYRRNMERIYRDLYRRKRR